MQGKWCNFEFSLAIHSDKPVWMVTSDGVVQAGDVPPKALRQIAEAAGAFRNSVLSFRCQESRCSTAADEAMIDAAVAEMGGYDRLDSKLKAVFRSAIEVAHTQLSEAFEMVKLEDMPIVSLNLCGADEVQLCQHHLTVLSGVWAALAPSHALHPMRCHITAAGVGPRKYVSISPPAEAISRVFAITPAADRPP
eukprot:s1051_g10.t1